MHRGLPLARHDGDADQPVLFSMSAPTAIALSGGVDSLFTAYLLKKAGQAVIGLHFLNGFEPHYIPPPIDTNTQQPILIRDPVKSGYEQLEADLVHS